MRKLNYVLSFSFLISILLMSCGPKVKTNKMAGVDMDSFSSYAFLPNQDTIQTSNYNNEMVNELVINQVREKMQEKGYRLDRSQPDLLVYYHLMLDEEMAVNASPVYTNYSYYRPGFYVGPYFRNYAYNNYFTIPRIAGTNVEQIPYKEGTIVIDLIDRRSNEIIWRGSAADVVTPNNLQEEIRAYISEIFEQFPK